MRACSAAVAGDCRDTHVQDADVSLCPTFLWATERGVRWSQPPTRGATREKAAGSLRHEGEAAARTGKFFLVHQVFQYVNNKVETLMDRMWALAYFPGASSKSIGTALSVCTARHHSTPATFAGFVCSVEEVKALAQRHP
jgi:hypothetical protein